MGGVDDDNINGGGVVKRIIKFEVSMLRPKKKVNEMIWFSTIQGAGRLLRGKK
jgi:hypothetical protein